VTKDDYLRIAREHHFFTVKMSKALQKMEEDQIIAFASAIAALEREECAKVCDELGKSARDAQKGNQDDLANVFLRHHVAASFSCAAAIRNKEGK
jgi:hypothetical protein